MNPLRSVVFALSTFALSTGAMADVTVNAVGVKFEPLVAYVQPGESVTWTGMDSHNVETLSAMIPEGGVEFNTAVGENVTETFDTPGIYVYKCTPHWGTRMGGVVVVGEPENASEILEAYLAAIEEDRANLLPAKGLIKKAGKDMEANGLM